MDSEMSWEQRVSERAHAIWEREGRPEGNPERHWAQAEEELRAEEQGQAEAPPTSTAGTETWTGPGGSVGGEPQAEEQGQARAPGEDEAKVTGKAGRRAKA
jgi:hypothetical protein